MRPSMVLLAARLRRRMSRCARDERGVSAVEFALLLPLMVTLYLGGVELSQGLAVDRKVTLAARTVADLSARTGTISSGEMTNILNAATAVMMPYPVANAKITISQVKIDANGQATIDWSATKNGTKRAKGATVTLPAALNVPDSYLIWGEVSYDYKPAIGYVITGTMSLKDQMYMRPRDSNFVQCLDSPCS